MKRDFLEMPSGLGFAFILEKRNKKAAWKLYLGGTDLTCMLCFRVNT